jgi:hypothetical protein
MSAVLSALEHLSRTSYPIQMREGQSAYDIGLALRLKNAKETYDNERESALHNYDQRSQREWLGGVTPPKDGKLMIHRATPDGAAIRPGDYVTNSHAYVTLFTLLESGLRAG